MRLQPNPPRLITVGIAIAIGVIGLIYAWPIDSLIPVLDPVANLVEPFGITLDREMGYLLLFISPALLAVGSLLPGI